MLFSSTRRKVEIDSSTRDIDLYREAPVRFGSVTVWEGNGSSGSGFRFWRFLCKKGFSVFQYSLTGKNGSGSGFGSWKTVPAVPVPLSVSGETVPTVPVSGFCNFSVFFLYFRGPTRNEDFVFFFVFFRISSFETFSYSVAPRGDPNSSTRGIDL